MDMILNRTDRRADGIFSTLTTDDASAEFVALEHAYIFAGQEANGWQPKIPNGTYQCVRGTHRLEHYLDGAEFPTFMITGVTEPDGKLGDGLLFHPGNLNRDTDGCVCIGQDITQSAQGQMITHSDDEFEAFMEIQRGVDSFTLLVTG